MTDQYDIFTNIMSKYDGFSDVEVKIHFWTTDLKPVDMTYFSNNCILSLTNVALTFDIKDQEALAEVIRFLKDNYSMIRADQYPSIARYEFDYKCEMAGFAARHNYGSRYSIIPINELSGPDAESVISTITLIS